MKKIITKEQAEKLLLSYFDNNNDLGDKLYEFLQDLCDEAVQKIESKHCIIANDGTPYTENDDVMWYDECRSEFMTAVYEKIQTGQL